MTEANSQPSAGATDTSDDSIGLIGMPSSGKTIYILSVTERLRRKIGRWRLGFGYPDALAYVESLRKQSLHGSTAREAHKLLPLFPADTLASIIGRRIPWIGPRLFTQYQVSVPDVAGEYISKLVQCKAEDELTPQRLGLSASETRNVNDFLSYLSRCGGLLCCIDPMGWNQAHTKSDPAVAIGAANGCQVTIGHVLKRRKSKDPLPLSVMLTMADEVENAGLRDIEVDEDTSLVLAYFRRVGASPGWMRVEDGRARFSIMTALRHEIDDLAYSESVAWDFVNCHAPVLADRLREWNEDGKLTARPYLISSTGKPLEKDADGSWRLPGRETIDPVRTADPIRSVLDRIHATRAQRRDLRVLTAFSALLVLVMTLGPWMVNIAAWTGGWLLDQDRTLTANALLATMHYHPVLALDRARAPKRLEGLADANMRLADALGHVKDSNANLSMVLTAANRAVALSAKPDYVGRRDDLLRDQISVQLERSKPERAFELLESCQGTLQPTPVALALIDQVLTRLNDDIGRDVRSLLSHAASTQDIQSLYGRIDRLIKFANAVESGTLFDSEYGSAPAARARVVGRMHLARCWIGRAQIGIAAWTPAKVDDKHVAFAKDNPPLDDANTAVQRALESGDTATITYVAEARLRIAGRMLTKFVSEFRLPRTELELRGLQDALQQTKALVDACPGLGLEADERLIEFKKELRSRGHVAIDALKKRQKSDFNWDSLILAWKSVASVRGAGEFEPMGADLLAQIIKATVELDSAVIPGSAVGQSILNGAAKWDSGQSSGAFTTLELSDGARWDLGGDLSAELAVFRSRVLDKLRSSMNRDSMSTANAADRIAGLAGLCRVFGGHSRTHRFAADVADAVLACMKSTDSNANEAAVTCQRSLLPALEALDDEAVDSLVDAGIDCVTALPEVRQALVMRSAFRGVAETNPSADQSRRLARKVERFDENMLKRLRISEQALPLSFIEELPDAISNGPEPRVSLGRWLHGLLQYDTPSSLRGLIVPIAREYQRKGLSSQDAERLFRALLEQIAAQCATEQARRIAIPAEILLAAEILGVVDASSALRAAEAFAGMIGQYDLTFVAESTKVRSAFHFGRSEVTVGQYRAMVDRCPPADRGGLALPFDKGLLESSPGPESEKPAFGVDMQKASIVARAVGGRLPTAEEWLSLYPESPKGIDETLKNGILDRAHLIQANDVVLYGEQEIYGMSIGVAELVTQSGESEYVLGDSWFKPPPPTMARELRQVSSRDYRNAIGFRLAADAIPHQVKEYLAKYGTAETQK